MGTLDSDKKYACDAIQQMVSTAISAIAEIYGLKEGASFAFTQHSQQLQQSQTPKMPRRQIREPGDIRLPDLLDSLDLPDLDKTGKRENPQIDKPDFIDSSLQDLLL